jgi:hypothetical protein
MNKNTVLVIAGILAFFMVLNIIIYFYAGKTEEGSSPVPRALQAVPKQEADAGPKMPVREPDDPAKFGIVLVDHVEKPVNQEQWDVFVEKVLDKSGVLDTEQAKEAVDKMKMNPDQFQKTMKRLDEEIAKIEQAARSDSTDPLLKRRLNILYQMKSISRVLERKGVVQSDAPSLPEYDQGVGTAAGSGVSPQ